LLRTTGSIFRLQRNPDLASAISFKENTMSPIFRRLTAALSVGTCLVLAVPASALDQAIDPDFVYEMVDIGFCALEPTDLTDEELIAVLRGDGMDFPVLGTIASPVTGEILGIGFFNRDGNSDAIMASILNLIITDDNRIMAMCMAIVPIADTADSSGQIALAGPGAEPSGGPAYLAVTRLLGRNDVGETITLAEVLRGEGAIAFSKGPRELVEGTLSLTGDIEAQTDLPPGGLDISFDFTLESGLTGFLRLNAN